ncbi:MAG: hypothetical protein FJ255_05850 [Phycisphaerae bacterium]|nr:hypothetical protein [Phycisphaerae bacterium]
MQAMETPSGPRLYLGGVFAGAGSIPSPNLVAWTGSAFEPGPGVGTEVLTLAVFPYQGQPRLVAGGFLNVAGRNVAALVGAAWAGLPGSPTPWVGGLGVFDDGSGPSLFVSTPVIGFHGSDYIARFDGAAWSGPGRGIISVARALTVFDHGSGPRLYASWPPVTAPTSDRVGVWNGSAWTGIGAQLPFRPDAMVVHDDGAGPALFVGGPGSGPTVTLARYDGSAWSGLGAGTVGPVRALASYDDGSGPALYAAGTITSAGGAPVAAIARWKNGRWTPLGPGLTGGSVETLAVFDDDGPGPIPPALYAGGTFTHAGGAPSPFLARWAPPACRADWTGDGVVDFNDLLGFLNDFNAAGEYADLNADGVVDFNDLLEFLNLSNAGC